MAWRLEKALGGWVYNFHTQKKYMVFNGTKMIHFGQFGYEDYTKHGDEKRRDNFRKRNMKWAYARKYSPAWLSFYLLW